MAKRLAQGHMPGFWELPGGKCEAGEDPLSALRREWLEETGMALVPDWQPTEEFVWDYPDRSLRFFPFYAVLPAQTVLEPDPGFFWFWVTEWSKDLSRFLPATIFWLQKHQTMRIPGR